MDTSIILADSDSVMASPDWAARLTQRGLVTRADLARAEAIASASDRRPVATLRALALVSDDDLAAALAEWSGLPLVGRERLAGPLAAIPDLNLRYLARRSLYPVALDGKRLTLAMADPGDEDALRSMLFASGAREVECWTARFGDIDEALARVAMPVADTPAAMDGPAALAELSRLNEEDSEAPVIRLVQRLLANAVDRRASDVHIEPMARSLRVRYRIDGRLIDVETLDEALAGPVATRVKVMAELDIAESRLPQDGRLRLAVRGREVDVRVATSPIAHGESIVLRLLGQQSVPLAINKLGLPEPMLSDFRGALARPHGIILVTGPTGSGKTTTLYAALQHLKRPDVKILSVEDPVEILIEGVNQVQVRPDIDLSFAAALRAFLRQDPDILMVGEIRDGETAEIAMRAAMTGHLVLSTLHTNSAAGAFARLRDLGGEPYLIAETLIVAVAQRLVRSLCGACKAQRAQTDEEAQLFADAGLDVPASVHEPVGCPACGGSGFAGRQPIVDMLSIDEEMRARIRADQLGQDEGPAASGLLRHGLALVASGATSLGEVRRAAQAQ